MQIRKDIILRGAKSKTVNALIDTGASLTLIPKKIADEIEVKYLNKKQQMHGAFEGGEDIAEIAAIDMNFPFLEDLNYIAEVAVSSKATDVLIGLDILNPLKITIDTDTHELSIKNEIVDGVKNGLAIVGGVAIAGTILYLLFGRKK